MSYDQICADALRTVNDQVNHPSHYTQGNVECIDAIESAVTHLTGADAYCTGNAIKYLFRWKQKGGLQDLEKAIWYINRMLEKHREQPKERVWGG